MKHLFLILILMLGSLPALAQDDCGNGLPCGPVPWELPDFPYIVSPTPIIVTAAPSVPTATPTSAPPTSTPYFIPSPTPFQDFTNFEDRIATIEAVIEATEPVIYNVEGTPVSLGDPSSLVNEDSMLFFSYIKGLSANNFGFLTPIMGYLIFVFLTSLIWALVTNSLPVISILIGIIRKIITFIMDMLPG